jgi:hypothetical protein
VAHRQSDAEADVKGNLNPFAVVFWVLVGIVGYLINGVTGALIGVAAAITLSFIVFILEDLR